MDYLDSIYLSIAQISLNHAKTITNDYFELSASSQLSNAIKFNTLFDKIYVINLDSRKDRWAKIMANFERLNIFNYVRVSGIPGKEEPHYSEWLAYYKNPALYPYEKKKYNRKSMKMPGSLGILKTNKIILEDAIANNYSSILVLQDDLIFCKDFYNNFFKSYNSITEDNANMPPKLIFLGAMQHRWNNIIINNLWYNPTSSAEGAFAVIINDCKEEMLDIINNYIMPIDSGALSIIQDKYTKSCYVIYPNVIISDITDSDLRGPRDLLKTPFKWDPSYYSNNN
jgi:hypothetical protein